MNKRIFVKKRPAYNQEAESLQEQLNAEYGLAIEKLELYNIYDIYGIDAAVYIRAKTSVFSEIMVDEVFETVPLNEHCYFAYETLPAQYDQRADSAAQCITLLDPQSRVTVRTGKLLVFNKALTAAQLAAVEKHLVNPIESQKKDLSSLAFSINTNPKPLKDLSGFNGLSHPELEALKTEMNLALSLQDLVFIQDYFKSEHRSPTETEIYVLDCYWSDHCRHTTFETILDSITIESARFKPEMEQALAAYREMRTALGSTKPVTLMDMASITGKYHTAVLKDQNIEISDEHNACSFFTVIKNQGKEEQWLIQFKNETHNHPTEIEPFGGASTCIGGAIRDPLSGRSYVYQAMRISGCGNILQSRSETLPNKLPQISISKNAASGYSSYGNQIGLATTYVRELYDHSYTAKHMEVGAVVGAVKAGDFKREKPEKGDIVVVIGGRVGRDGIQGASGSSISHTEDSLHSSSSQVQKGNAIEERKLQRLFRKPEVTRLIKKCNDFGAGGVCVAVGELAESVEIHLDQALTKYGGLNPTEIAISESQERMAVVIAPEDYERFVAECEKENIEHYRMARITDHKRLEMYYHGERVVDIGAEFLATNGIRQHSDAVLADNSAPNPFDSAAFSKEQVLAELASLNVTCQKGLASQFDASIGASTVLMPFAGKHRMTPIQASVQALPTLYSTGDTATVLTYGFIPKISHYSPFLSAIYAVLESLAKVYAVGGNKDSLYFSFQEYFEKLGTDPVKWGKVTQSLLGSIYAQKEIGRPSIGGKDSMSGTFHDLNVVETLISFACAPVKIEDVITPELKQIGSTLYYIPVVKDAKGYPDIAATLKGYEALHGFIKEKKILSAYVQEEGSIAASLVKAALGNGLGFTVTKQDILNFVPASIIVESAFDLPFEKIGTVSETVTINGTRFEQDELYRAYTGTLGTVYPLYWNLDKGACENITVPGTGKRYYHTRVDEVRVLIPVFPGTNCEYDSAKAFMEAGASVKMIVIKNKKEHDIETSIDEFAREIENAHIIMFSGGFSSGDEPDGSAKFIVNVLKNSRIKAAITRHLTEKKLILGICNGFQALIKSGLLPYGEIRDLTENDLTLYRNDSYRHASTTVLTRTANTSSPWTQGFEPGTIHEVLISHGEGKLVGTDIEKFKHLAAFQYCDCDGTASLNGKHNPNGSLYAIEGLISKDGLVLGKMGHSERNGPGLYKTNTVKIKQDIFKNGVDYFKGA
ncbi:MAG: phosphoribosylformylglycinamidine synthase [Treponema sp.]